MSNIIKRRKTVQYAQIHNNPLQKLEDIRSIGLLAHLMSLPDDWEIRKMQLYKKFGRAAITHAINELESKKYWLSIKYRNGKNNEHIYYISDIPFTDEEVLETIKEVEEEFTVMEISEPFVELVPSIVQNRQLKNEDASIAQNQQLNINTSSSTVENQHLSKETETNDIDKNEIHTKKTFVNKFVNKKNEEDSEKLIKEYMTKGLNKELCFRILDEILPRQTYIKNFGGYFRSCLDLVLYRVKVKTGEIDPNEMMEERIKEMQSKGIPIFNWLTDY